MQIHKALLWVRVGQFRGYFWKKLTWAGGAVLHTATRGQNCSIFVPGDSKGDPRSAGVFSTSKDPPLSGLEVMPSDWGA